MRKYDQWSRNLSGGRTLNDAQQIQLLNSCLPEILQKELQLWEREKGRKLTFLEFYSHLEAKFGRAHSESMRKRWLEVQLPKCSGKWTVQAFDEFRVNFKLAFADVPDGNKEEARRVVLDKLTPFMRKWVIEAQAKRMRDKPICEMRLPTFASPEHALRSAQVWSGAVPTRVEDRGGAIFGRIFRRSTSEKIAGNAWEKSCRQPRCGTSACGGTTFVDGGNFHRSCFPFGNGGKDLRGTALWVA